LFLIEKVEGDLRELKGTGVNKRGFIEIFVFLRRLQSGHQSRTERGGTA
jgi:hypothetical protein